LAGSVTDAVHEIELLLAVVILGGFFTSTVLNIFLRPAVYLRDGRSSAFR
jgi:Cu/Ag efflux pump CusA